MYDFGSLSSNTEGIYIKAMLRRILGQHNALAVAEDAEPPAPAARDPVTGYAAYQCTPRLNPFAEFVEVFSELVCAAQVGLRAH